MALSASQLAFRRDLSRVGCSEIHRILAAPYPYWLERTTGIRDFDETAQHVRIGNYLERGVAEDYAFRMRQAGTPVHLTQVSGSRGEALTLVSDTYPFLCGTPDFLPVRGGNPWNISSLADIRFLHAAGLLDRGLEIKVGGAIGEVPGSWGNVNPVAELEAFLRGRCESPDVVAAELAARFSVGTVGAETTDDDDWQRGEVPLPYLAQCVGYMALTGLPRWDLHRLRFGWGMPEFKTYTIERDLVHEQLILGKVEAFVRDHLLTGIPPEPTAAEDVFVEMARRADRPRLELRKATDEEVEMLEALKRAQEDVAEASERVDAYKAMIARSIEVCDGITSDLGTVKWSDRAGRASVDARVAVTQMVDALVARGATRVEAEDIGVAAISAATKTGKSARVLLPNWKGKKDE